MYLWGCGCFNHKYIAFWRQLITSPLSEEIIQIPPPFSPLPVSVVWEFVFSICPWSECGQQKNGVEQTADAVDRDLRLGCAPGCPWIQHGGNVLAPCCSWHRWICKCHWDLPSPSRHHGTHAAAVLRAEIAACPWGWARQRNFQLTVDWTLLTATSQKIPSVTTATYLFFVVAVESQYFYRNLHSKPSDWICVFKLSRHAWLCCSKNYHLPNPDNLLYFLFWPSDYGSFLVCFELTGKVSRYWFN